MIVVYTCITDDYDTIRRGGPREEGVKYVSYLSRPSSRAEEEGWTYRQVLPVSQAPTHKARRTARFYKVMGPVLFPEASATIWIDGHLSLTVSPTSLVEGYLGDKINIALYKHPERDCLYKEGLEVIHQQRESPELVGRQLAYYLEEKIPGNLGLPQTGVLIRKNTPETLRFCFTWWEQICMWSCRDQISFPFVYSRFNPGIYWVQGSMLDVCTQVPHKDRV